MVPLDKVIVEDAGVSLAGNKRAAAVTNHVAVVGCGYWGKHLVRNFAQLRALRLICDSDEQLLQAQVVIHADSETVLAQVCQQVAEHQ